MTRPQRADALIAGVPAVAVVVEQGLVHDRPVPMLLSAFGCLTLVWRGALPVASTLTSITLLAARSSSNAARRRCSAR